MKAILISGIVLMMLLVVVLPIGSVGVVSLDSESGELEAQSEVDWWPMFRHDPRHSGYSTSKAPNTNNTLWIHLFSSQVRSLSLAVIEGRIYVGLDNKKVYSLNATTGNPIWNYTAGQGVASTPAVVDGRVYVGADDNNFYCLNASTGTRIWRYINVWRVVSSPAVVDNKVYVGSDAGYIYCLNASNGVEIWKYGTDWNYVLSSPAVVDGKVYVGAYDKNIYCLNASTGKKIWNYTTGHFVSSSPAVADGKVYVGSGKNTLYCFNASSGVKIWHYETSGDVFSPAIVNGKVYVAAQHRIYAFGPSVQPSVGGIYIPVNKLELLAPYIGLTILFAVAVVMVVFFKRKKDKS